MSMETLAKETEYGRIVLFLDSGAKVLCPDE
jgi:hypothetical protein